PGLMYWRVLIPLIFWKYPGPMQSHPSCILMEGPPINAHPGKPQKLLHLPPYLQENPARHLQTWAMNRPPSGNRKQPDTFSGVAENYTGQIPFFLIPQPEVSLPTGCNNGIPRNFHTTFLRALH